MIAGDLIALSQAHGVPHLLIEVGGSSKRLRVAFTELRDSLAAGFVPMVIRFVDRKRYYYLSEDERFLKLDHALVALETR